MRLLAHARVRPHGTGGDTLLGDVLVRGEEDGKTVALVSGIVLKKADAASLARVAGGRALDGITYEVEWHEQALRAGVPTVALAPLGATLEPRLAALSAEHGFAAFAGIEPTIDRAAAAYVVEAFEKLGWRWRSEARLPAAELAQRLGVDGRYRRALERLLELLAEQGRVRRTGDAWEPADGPAEPPADETRRGAARRSPGVRGRAEPGASLRGAPARDPARRHRPALAPLPRRFERRRRSSSTSARPARAPTTPWPGRRSRPWSPPPPAACACWKSEEAREGRPRSCCRASPRSARSISSRISRRSSPRGRPSGSPSSRSSRPRLSTSRRTPPGQGLEGRQFEVIVAANVLHATADLRRTFRHVRRLLAPGGILVLLEVTRPQSWIDVTFGLTEGWWLFTDADLRRSSPLLSRAEWLAFLREEAGFAEAVAVPGADPPREPVQAVVLARAPIAEPRQAETGAAPAGVDFLILGDDGGVGIRLGQRLESEGERVALARTGDAFARTPDGYVVSPGERGGPGAPARGRGRRPARGPPLGPRRADVARGERPDALREYEKRACGSALAIAQALIAPSEGAGRPPRLTFVTRGSQAAAGAVVSPAGATLWGLGKVVALEHPDLHCLRIDLAPGGQAGELDALTAELRGGDREDQVALRPGGRFVPRLVPRTRKATTSVPGPWELGIATRGTLDSLEIRPAARRDPAADEIEIDVRAIGLNFRDVLSALNLYPGTPPPFGSECAGRVLRVGSGVTGIAPGDDVIAIGAGAFRSHALVPASLVVPKPFESDMGRGGVARHPVRHRLVLPASRGEDRLWRSGSRPRRGGRSRARGGPAGAGRGSRGLRHRGEPGEEGAPVVSRRGDGVGLTVARLRRGDPKGHGRARGRRRAQLALGDFVGATFEVTAKGGRFVEIGKRDIWEPERARASRADVSYTIVDWSEAAREDPALVRGMLENVVREIAEGRLKPLPRTVFRPSEAILAFRYMAQGTARGQDRGGAGVPRRPGRGDPSRPHLPRHGWPGRDRAPHRRVARPSGARGTWH